MSEKQLKIKIDAPKPTKEELESLIIPLIPEPKQGEKGKDGAKGKDGKDYKLTQADKREIAKTIKVPIVEKIVERTEVIKEQPIIKEVAINETPEVLKEKILNIGITYEEIKETPNIPEIVRNATIASKTTSLSELDDVNLAGLTQTNGKYNLGSGSSGGQVNSIVAGTNISVDSTDPANPIVNNTLTAYTDEMAQDAVGNILTDTATIDFTYNDTTPSITADVKDDSITFAKMQNIGADHFIGRHTSGNGDPQQVSASQARSILNVENGAEVNNISDTDATDLTDGGNTTLHIHDSRYYTETETDTLLSGYISTSQKGANSGVAELDSGGKVPSSQLPSFVDDVVEVANFAALPVTGETGKIYVTLDTNLTYRWSGTAYVEISASLALGETSSTAYRGDRGKIAYDHSQVTTGNPHNVLATQITDFDTEVSNNTDVAANTTARHDALTVTDSSEIDFTLTGQDLTASVKPASIDETKLDASVNASLDLADSALQPADIASGTITPRADDINLSGGSDGDVLTVQADGSLALETPTTGGSATNNVYFTARLATDAALPANTYLLGVLTAVSLGALTVDGVAVANGDLILVKNEATGANNGLYTVTNLGSAGVAYVLTRSTQMDASGEFVGAVIPVRSEGTVNANTEWRCTNTTAPTVGTTAITFAIQSPNNVSDTAYDATSWNGVTTIAPSKNAVRDKIDTMDTSIALKANDADVVHDTGNETIAGVKTFSSDPIIPDEAYGVGWNGSLEPATKNAIYDKIEATLALTDGDKGDITVSSSGTVWGIDDGVVTLAKMASINSDKLLGRVSGGAGVVEEVDFSDLGQSILASTTASQVRIAIDAQEDLSGASLFTATVAADDKILGQDTDGSDSLRTFTAQSIANLAPIASVTDTNDIDLTLTGTALSADLKATAISAKTSATLTGTEEALVNDGGTLKKTTTQDIANLAGGLPAGAVTDFAGATLPSGWLWCDGSVISRTTYADLFTAISTTYGAGDGSTTFALPDARGRVTAGKDNMDNTVGTGGGDAGRLTSGSKAAVDGDTLGASGGVQEHLLLHEESGVPAHSHPYLRHNTVARTSTGANTAGAGSVGATTSNNTAADAAQAHTNVQPTLVLNKIIKI